MGAGIREITEVSKQDIGAFMKKTTKLKSCLTSTLSIVVIAIAIGYELKIDWVVDLISARSLIVGAIAAAFFNAYGSFEFGDEKKKP